MIVKVDMIDGKYVICVDKDKKMYAFEKKEINAPSQLKKGWYIEVDDNTGELSFSEHKPSAKK